MGGAVQMGQSPAYYERKRAEELTSQISRLQSYVKALELMAPEPATSAPGVTRDHRCLGDGKRVFVVHGRDDRYKHEVARLLTDLMLDP